MPSVAPDLDRLPADRREIVAARMRRWLPTLAEGVREVYGEDTEGVVQRLLDLAVEANAERSDELHRLDLDRTLRPDWLQDPSMIGYACYTDRFAGTLTGLGERIDHLEALGVRYLHLMPLLQPREGDNDGGYAVADYTQVRSDLGTMDDLETLAGDLRARGMSLVVDLVLNHVAREHAWARAARAGDPRYRDYFHLYPDREMPDAYEATLPEVFPDFAPGSFTWDEEADAWVWTTFNSFQWDLRWSNPEVLLEMAGVVLDLANRGVEVLRLDAIAFIWKRLGTTSQGEPEVHLLTEILRALARIACPALAFKAEAIVAPEELVAYLGRGRHTGKISDLAYHNSLMVQAWSLLATGDVRLTAHALAQLPPKPASATWVSYLRGHDDVGWAISDTDAAAVGLSGGAHRSFLADWYTGAFPGSDGRGLTFQENPATNDRRTSGNAAALVGLQAAEGSGAPVSDPAVARACDRLRLAHALVVGWGGVPVIWSGDELGQPDDPAWADEPGHADDNRWAGRPRLDWDRARDRDDPGTVAGRVFTDLQRLTSTRARLAPIHGSVETMVEPVDDPGVLVLSRHHHLGTLVQLYNVTDDCRPWPGHRARALGVEASIDELTGEPLPWGGDDQVWLPPHAALWLLGPASG